MLTADYGLTVSDEITSGDWLYYTWAGLQHFKCVIPKGCKLVVDMSFEGGFYQYGFDAILANITSDMSPTCVLLIVPIEIDAISEYKTYFHNPFLYAPDIVEYNPQPLDKRFIMPIRGLHGVRAKLAHTMHSAGVCNDGYVSFPGDELTPPYAIDTPEYVKPGYHNYTHDDNLYEYALKSGFYVNSETLFHDGNGRIPSSAFMTEKWTKTIRSCRPSIALATHDFHNIVHNVHGYRLFDRLINYSFDSVPDEDERFVACTDEIKRLCKLPIEFWQSHEEYIASVATYNLQLFNEYSMQRQQHEHTMVNIIMDFYNE